LRETTQKYMDDISGSMSDDQHSSHGNTASTYQPGTYEDSSYYDSAYYDSEHYRSLDDGHHSESNPNTDSTTTADNSHVGEPATQGAESTTAASTSSVTLKPAEGTISRGSAIESPTTTTAAEKA
jgi:hypothetical protein